MSRLVVIITGKTTKFINTKELTEVLSSLLRSLTGENVSVFDRSIQKSKTWNPAKSVNLTIGKVR